MGTRMLELTHDEVPKPMLPLNGKPMIEWQIESLEKDGIREFIIIIGYLGNVIQGYFEDGTKWDVNISYIEEEEPLGSAGALYYSKEMLHGRDAILVFGDVMFDLDWKRFISFHEKHKGIVTLLAHPNAHPYDSDLLRIQKDSSVSALVSKSSIRNYYYKNIVNSGISIFRNKLLKELKCAVKNDYEKDLVKPLIAKGMVYAYQTPEYVKDVGTPERFLKASEDQKNRIWERKSLKNKQRAIFLDRDGTINVFKGFIKHHEDFELISNAAAAIKIINRSSYLAIITTNQPVIARGECTYEELERIHMKMETELGKEGAYVDDLFFCPHHPDRGFQGEVTELKLKCECRKPGIGMIIEAADRYNIDLSESWYIGDTTVDIMTGKNAGLRTVLVHTGEGGEDGKYDIKADYEKKDLIDAVKFILSVSG